jgi:superfamily I DNA/RNA helicase
MEDFQMTEQTATRSLSAEQTAILQHFLESDEGFRVEAPPGAGKTHLLTQILLAAPEPVLVCMFTSAAQQTLSKRLAGSSESSRHRVTTLHAMACRLTEICWEQLGFPHKPRHIDAAESGVTEYSEFKPRRIAERRAKGQYTYNDSLYYLLEVLRTGSFRLRYPALLVDEYQDLNSLQWQIIEALMAQGAKRLVLLGDRHQCIYQFLKASADHPLAASLQVRRLTYSHRCHSRIAAFASQIISESFDGPPGGVVQLHHYQRIHDFCEQAVRLLRKREAHSAAILCRTNRTCDEVRSYLASQKIPVAGKSVPQAIAFWSHPAITWVIDFLENPLLKWPMALPFLGVNRYFTSLEALEHPPQDMNVEEAARAIQFARAIQSMHDAPTLRDSLELVDFLLTFPADWVDPLYTFKRQAGQIRSHADLLHLRDTKVEPYKSPGVEVLTIHAAKGREWQQVIVDASLNVSAVWNEQKLVAYVAATRAEEYLDIFCPYFGNAWKTIDYFAFDP